MKIVAVIPAYNEERAIGRVIDDIKSHVDAIVVVDDGSGDNTYNAARAAGAIVLRHAINRGQGAGLATATEYALRKLGADIIVHYDADGQHAAEEIDEMVKPIILGGADVALGSRFLGKKSNVPALRRLVLMGGIIFTRLTSGLKVTDTHNGFRALSRDAAEKIKITQDRMAHASEILDEIGRNELRYVEVPVTVKYTPESLAKGQGSLGSLKIVWDYLLNKFL